VFGDGEGAQLVWSSGIRAGRACLSSFRERWELHCSETWWELMMFMAGPCSSLALGCAGRWLEGFE